jgi:cytochrome d ubiquinol oxidase subunit II
MQYQNQETFSRLLRTAGITFVALLGATVFLPKTNYIFLTRWTTEPTMLYLGIVAVLIGITALTLGYYVYKGIHPERLYTLCLLTFALGFVGMLIGTYPYMLPPNMTLFDSASPDNTLAFMLWGIGPILPIILGYNYYLHKIFGKDAVVPDHEGYEG